MRGSTVQEGTAYVFAQSGTAWNQQAELIPSDGVRYGFFGSSVAVDGSTIVAGYQSFPDSAYVYTESGGTWSLQQVLIPTGATGPNDAFGQSVSISGSTIVVGAWDETVGLNIAQGKAYVFTESSGTWGQQVEVYGSDGAEEDAFGSSVAVSGSSIIAGAPQKNVGSNQSQGEAYAFGSSGPLYTLSASPGTLTVPPGTQRASTITITPYNGFSGSVLLEATNLPSGVTAGFSPNPASTTSTLTLMANSTAPSSSATLVFTGASGNLTQTMPLALNVTAEGTAKVSPSSLSFGNQGVNTTSSSRLVAIINKGTVTLDIDSIALTAGTNFAISSNECGATLVVPANCHVFITFTPTQLGEASDTLTFNDSATGNPQIVPLSGTGVADVTLAPTSASFDSVPQGTSSAAKNFILKNNASTALSISGISFAGANPGDFFDTGGTCGASVAGKTSCTISVTFTPSLVGAESASLSVTNNALSPYNSISSALSGKGIAQATVSPASITYSNQKVGTTSAAHMVTLKNNLSTAVTISGFTFTGDDPGDFSVSVTTCGASLAAKSTCTISVVLTPTATGMRTATLNVNDSANNSPQTVRLSGTGD